MSCSAIGEGDFVGKLFGGSKQSGENEQEEGNGDV
jgi:hypothetical protein